MTTKKATKATKASTTTTKPRARKATTKRKQATSVTDLELAAGTTLRLATDDAAMTIRRGDSGVIVRIDYADARWREILL